MEYAGFNQELGLGAIRTDLRPDRSRLNLNLQMEQLDLDDDGGQWEPGPVWLEVALGGVVVGGAVAVVVALWR
jgi:hypothetical protein